MTLVPVATTSELHVHEAVATVDDPEYPGISIVDLGLLESISIDEGRVEGINVTVGLIPTFSGCPALELIAEDVRAAVQKLPAVSTTTVEWLNRPAWTLDRVSGDARAALASDFTVAVELGRAATPVAACPLCGEQTVERSMFGPSRCRAVHHCTGCGEAVEVLRG